MDAGGREGEGLLGATVRWRSDRVSRGASIAGWTRVRVRGRVRGRAGLLCRARSGAWLCCRRVIGVNSVALGGDFAGLTLAAAVNETIP